MNDTGNVMSKVEKYYEDYGLRARELAAQGLRLRVNNKAMFEVSCLTPCALRLMPSAYAAPPPGGTGTRKPAENDAQWEKSHFWMEPNCSYNVVNLLISPCESCNVFLRNLTLMRS